MTEPLPSLHQYLFIDECGDPNFYGKNRRPLAGTAGYQPLLLMGLLSTANRRKLRQAVLDFQQDILSNPLYNSIHSMTQPNWFLHARSDHSDVRSHFFDFLRQLPGFSVNVAIGRKNAEIFARKHHNKPSEFYFDLIQHLLQGRLQEQPKRPHSLYLAQRGTNNIERFQKAVSNSLNKTRHAETLVAPTCHVVMSKQYPELSVIDYCLWAVQRYIYKEEIRFYQALENKFELVLDLYDYESSEQGGVYYPGNPFRLEKASPFEKPL